MKKTKTVLGGNEARQKILEAVTEMSKVVGSTMGAKGRNVLLESIALPGRPEVVNDGVRIAREFEYSEPVANMAVQLIKEASIRTNDDAGDGTTCATVLAGAILAEGYSHLMKGSNAILLKSILQKEAQAVQKELSAMAIPVEKEEQLVQIAKISVQNDEIGEMIGKTMFKVGKEGAITVEDSVSEGVTVEDSLGARFEMGHAGGHISDMDRFEHKADNTKFLVMNTPLEDHEFDSRWLKFIQKLVEVDNENKIQKIHVPAIVIISEKLPMRVLQFIRDPHNLALVKFTWVKPPSFGEKRTEILRDFCSMVGAKLVDKEDGVYINKLTIDDLGIASRVHITRNTLTVSPSEVSPGLKDRIEMIRSQILVSNSALEIANLKKRLAVLSGGVSTIKVGGPTESEVKELKLRIEDAINASRSAMESGILPGGGVALADAVGKVSLRGEAGVGYSFLEAFKRPFAQILENAGYSPESIVSFYKDKRPGEGINVLTDGKGQMVEMGIVDPLKVISRALANAVSVAGLLFTADFAVTIEKEDLIDKFKKTLKDG